jgi:hypothetical protein
MLALFQTSKRPQIPVVQDSKSTKARTNKREETESNTNILSFMHAILLSFSLLHFALSVFQSSCQLPLPWTLQTECKPVQTRWIYQ